MTKIIKKSKKTFILLAFLLLLTACLIAANYFSLLLIKTDSKGEEISSPEMNVYFLSLSKSKLKKEASSIAPDFQKIGAGGYIWQFDEYYHVLSSGYINKNDAELVKNSIKLNHNLDSEILSLNLGSITISGDFSAEEKKVISQSLSVAQTCFNSFYDIAISLDTGVYNETTAKLKVNDAVNNISTIYANFSTLFQSKLNEPLLDIKSHLQKIVDVCQQLASDNRLNKEQTYSSHIKYRYIEAINIYYEYTK